MRALSFHGEKQAGGNEVCEPMDDILHILHPTVDEPWSLQDNPGRVEDANGRPIAYISARLLGDNVWRVVGGELAAARQMRRALQAFVDAQAAEPTLPYQQGMIDAYEQACEALRQCAKTP